MGDALNSFVGREKEMLFFENLLAATPGARTALVVVSGGSGVGKTRLLQEIAQTAGRNKAVGVYGSAIRAVQGRAYGIWEQIIDELASEPLTGLEFGDQESSLRTESHSVDRAEFFAEAATHLRDCARKIPLVVLLDDLEHADAESVLMLRYLAAELADEHCIFVGATGSSSENSTGQASEQLQKLLLASHRIELMGLSYEEVDELVSRPQAVSFFHDISDGNPLLIGELLALGGALQEGMSIEAQGDLLALTQVRIESQEPDVGWLLVALAVFERPPALSELADISDMSTADMTELVEKALAGGVAARIARGPFAGHFEMAHGLMRTVVLASASPAQVQAVRQRRVADLSANPVERARHLLLLEGPASERLSTVLAAAQESLETFAFEEAVELGELGLGTIPSLDQCEGTTAVRLALVVGQAHWRVGNHALAEASYLRAGQLLGQTDCPEVTAQLALGPHLDFDLADGVARRRIKACQEALDNSHAFTGLERVKVLATLALAQYPRHPDAAVAAAEGALRIAAELACPVAEAYALAASAMSDLSPGTVAARHGAARRILAVVEQHNEFRLASVGYFLLLIALLEKGDIQELDLQLTHRSDIVSQFPELHQSRQAHWFRCLRAILDGDTVLAERLVLEAHAAAMAADESSADAVFTGQMGVIRWMQGKIDDAESSFLHARRERPEERIWAASLVWLWHKQGRTDAAEQLLDTLQDVSAIPRNRMWLSTMTALAEIASELGTEEFGAEIRYALLPYARQVIPLGVGMAFWGTVARSLGLLTERLGFVDEAQEHLRAAVDVSARSGAQAWLAEAQIELAEFMLRHLDRSGSSLAEAARLLEQAAASARRRDFPLLAARAKAAQNLVPAAEPPTTGPTAGTSLQNCGQDGRVRVRVMGAFDVVSHHGQRARWTSRKARELLKLLVSTRGVPTSREVFMDVLWPGLHPERLANRFAVAINTIRRAMDPNRNFPPQYFVMVDAESVRLQLDHVSIDVEEFFRLARGTTLQDLRSAANLYLGDVFAEEPYADWATTLRHEAQLTYCQLAVTLAEQDAAAGKPLSASQLYRSVLDMEPGNQEAGRGLVAALTAMGAHGQAQAVASGLGRWEQELGAFRN